MSSDFVFIIPSYNNADWYQHNIKSISKQDLTNWRAIYVDDASTDNTLKLVQEYVYRLGLSDKFTYIKNSRKLGPAGSRYQAYSQTDDNEICCMLDGDDWLYGTNVLDILSHYYLAGYNCTYGSYYLYTEKGSWDSRSYFNIDYDNKCKREKKYRESSHWIAKHFRTMKSYLIKDIDTNMYLKMDNEWIQVCTDKAEMYYSMEKPEAKPVKINELIYVYNKTNSVRYPTSFYNSKQMKSYKEKVNNFVLQP
jgi:glycosyltransferase involved in cell wall biosynthesis